MDEYFITASAVRLRRVNGQWAGQFAFCGGEPILLIKSDEDELLVTGSTPLGVSEHIDPGGHMRALEKGDLVIMVTDGLTPEGNQQLAGKSLSEWKQDMVRTVRNANTESLAEIAEQLVAQCSSEPQDDDIAMVLVRCDE
jgi:serine phosphatase RsbU (regulator of sigma subunit)